MANYGLVAPPLEYCGRSAGCAVQPPAYAFLLPSTGCEIINSIPTIRNSICGPSKLPPRITNNRSFDRGMTNPFYCFGCSASVHGGVFYFYTTQMVMVEEEVL